MPEQINKTSLRRYLLTCSFIVSLLLLLMGSVKVSSAQFVDVQADTSVKARFAQRPPINLILKTSLFSIFYWQIPFTGEYRVLGEFMVGKKQSLLFGGSYLTRSLFLVIAQKAQSGTDPISANGYRIQAAYRYYFFNKMFRPEGLFLSLHTSFASINYHFKGYPDDYQLLEHFNINLLIGGQFVIANRVSLELFLGPGYKNNSYINRSRPGYEVFYFDDLSPWLRRNIKFTLGMNVGIAL